MKNIIKKTALTAAVSLFLIGVISSASLGRGNFSESPFPAEQNIEEENGAYIIGIYGDRIAVFKKGSETPETVTDISISEFTAADREILKKGIIAKSKSEVHKILEDYY